MQAVSTNKETNLGNTKSSRTMNKHYSREKFPFREPWKKKERKKEALYILIDSLDFLIKG